MNELNEYLKRNKIKCLYHVTYEPVLSSIELTGIGAHPTQRINSWKGLSNTNHVYLAHTPGLAGSFAEAADNEEIPEDWLWSIIYLEVSISELDFSLLSFDDNNQMEEPDRTFKYAGVIPYSSIRIIDY